MGNVTDRLMKLNSFVEQYFHLIVIINKVHQTSQSLITTGICKNTIRYVVLGTFIFIYLSLYSESHLRNILVDIRTSLSHYLRLPVDPTEELWKHYSILACVTLLEDDKLGIVICPLIE